MLDLSLVAKSPPSDVPFIRPVGPCPQKPYLFIFVSKTNLRLTSKGIHFFFLVPMFHCRCCPSESSHSPESKGEFARPTDAYIPNTSLLPHVRFLPKMSQIWKVFHSSFILSQKEDETLEQKVVASGRRYANPLFSYLCRCSADFES